MRYMSAQEIRETWIRFFKEKGHRLEQSASLIPIDDPTLLWINAGIAPLKKYFDGSMKPKSPRIVNIQKCIRTNDIDNVGLTSRHHTFFEMLGNFSIGDYFKIDAIRYGFEILTSNEYFGIPKEKLFITYYPDDMTTKNEWINQGIDESHLIPLETNFWDIGPGPCGPDTEIFYDRGEQYDSRGKELIENDIENERFIEIWNIVFSQYNSEAGKKRSEYKELPHKNIDTGAGLERFACIMQNTKTNFETDLFLPIIKKTEELSKIKYEGQFAFKVIADHIKTLVFAISDGANLSNEGRGYVLRRILRRATKYAKKINIHTEFLYLLVDSVIETMGSFYPNLYDTKEIVTNIIKKEETKFLETISDGEKHLLNSIINDEISGENAFKLYDTFGFPIELTLEYAKEHNVKVDIKGFNQQMLEQKQRSKNARNITSSMQNQEEEFLSFNDESEFIGYDTLKVETKVIKVFDSGIVLSKTPFYANMGGQISDYGTINGIEVKGVIRLPHNQHLHIIETDTFNENDEVIAIVDKSKRFEIEKNHTATHLLHQALKDTLGSHLNQQGSSLNERRLTFDFNHYEKVSKEKILDIENIVKKKINEAINVVTHILPIEEAKKLGANMLFGEKYSDIVRVVDIGGYSKEFCGGTHVKNTKEIKNFIITSLESIGSGIYRLEAITNLDFNQSFDYLMQLNDTIDKQIEKIHEFDKSKVINKPSVIHSYQDIINYQLFTEELKQLNKQLEKVHNQEIVRNVLKNAADYIPHKVNDDTFIVTNNIPQQALKPLIDMLYDKIKTNNLVLVNKDQMKATILVKSSTKQANTLLGQIISKINGTGGGGELFAQGGTTDLVSLDKLLTDIL